MKENDKLNRQYSSLNKKTDTNKGPFHEHPSENPEVQKRNAGKMGVDEDPELAGNKKAKKRLKDDPGAYLLRENSEDEGPPNTE